MVRKPAVLCPSPSLLRDRPEVLVDIELAVVTPLFGGGASPGIADGHLPVRGGSVRGQLRFWWRACHAHLFADAASLFAREAAIWGEAGMDGSARGPSAIDVEVTIVQPGEPAEYFPWRQGTDNQGQPTWKRRDTSYPDYALFPFFGVPGPGLPPKEEWKPPPAIPLVGVQFRLCLSVATSGARPLPRAELEQAAKRAVTAWVLFGGVGARTRRGCGSLWCVTEDARFRPLASPPGESDRDRWTPVGGVWLPAVVDDQQGVTKLGVPRLQGAKVVVAPAGSSDPIAVWNEAVELLRKFRQGRGIGRNPGAQRPGLSRWPEPYSIRAQWGTLDPAHNAESHPFESFYPRADLGLPINFQFPQPGRKPEQLALQGKQEGATRMASPVIVKALALPDDRFAPIVLVLNAPHLWDPGVPRVELERREDDRKDIEPDQLRMPPNALQTDPRGLTAAAPTIRDAFVAWAEHADGWNATAVQLP